MLLSECLDIGGREVCNLGQFGRVEDTAKPKQLRKALRTGEPPENCDNGGNCSQYYRNDGKIHGREFSFLSNETVEKVKKAQICPLRMQ